MVVECDSGVAALCGESSHDFGEVNVGSEVIVPGENRRGICCRSRDVNVIDKEREEVEEQHKERDVIQ
jgi:hypothetical protein